MLSLGVFAAIYHPVGTTMLIAVATRRGKSLAMNGVAGNLGAALAAAGTAAIAAFFGWRAAFIVPGIICVHLRLRLPLCGVGAARRQEPNASASRKCRSIRS